MSSDPPSNSAPRAAIVGCGVIAPTHARCYRALQADLRWACDLLPEKAEALAAEFEIPNTTTEYHRLLEDPAVDCVSVCTDHASHVPVATAALAAGKHVLVEKAPAANAEGMRELVAAADAAPDQVTEVVFQHRFDPVNRYLKELVETGRFGKILTAGIVLRCRRTRAYYRGDDWRGTWGQEGGAVLINQAIHFIDQLIWLLGPAQSLTGMYANLTHGNAMETEDTAAAVLRFPHGAIGTIEATCSSHLGWEPTVSIHGTHGSVEMRNDTPMKLSFADKEFQDEAARNVREYTETPDSDVGKDYYGHGHPAQIADFLDAIRHQRRPAVTVRSAQHTLNAVLAIYESQRHRTHVVLPEAPAISRPDSRNHASRQPHTE